VQGGRIFDGAGVHGGNNVKIKPLKVEKKGKRYEIMSLQE
jgi:hypothetical protein